MVGAMTSRLARAGIASIEAFWKEADRPGGGALTDALAWGLAGGAATAQNVGTSLAPASAIRRLRPKAVVQEWTNSLRK
jgi:monoamine oxidase